MVPEGARNRSAPFGEVRLDVDVGPVVSAEPRSEDPFHIVVLGDFRGRGGTDVEPGADVARRVPVPVDRDDFDDVLRRFAPRLSIRPVEDAPEQTLRFGDLDDFHPDRLFERLPLFRSMRELRERLTDPAGFDAAARALGDPRPPTSGNTREGPDDPPPIPAPPTERLLDRIVRQADATARPPAADRDPLDAYLRRLVAPHLVSRPDPRQLELLGEIDTAIARTMRAILHDPGFQALEALWRSVFLLVRRLRTGASLRVHLLDLTRAELAADLEPERPIEQTTLFRLLAEREPAGAEPWSLLIGHFTWGPSEPELRQLGRIAGVARRAGAPWISAADPRLVGCPSFGTAPDPDDWGSHGAAAWDELRRSPDAAALGLVLPRFLLRLPYGEQADPCEAFGFEEFQGVPAHEHLLWGNPAIACGLLLAESFGQADRSPLRPRLELEGLPLHLVRGAGEPFATPCAEALMTERAASRILEAGVMPLASLKDRDAVRLVRFQSVAHPVSALAGRWTSAPAR